MDRSMVDRTTNVSWIDILSALHQSVRTAVLDAGREAIGTKNAKGDDVKVFDLTAEDAALAVLGALQPPIPVSFSGVMLGASSPSGPSREPARGISDFGPPSRFRGVWHSAQWPSAATR